MQQNSWRTWLLAGLSTVGFAEACLAGGPFPFTSAWYAERANDPPGTRQVESHGKLWPPYPRPVGPKQTKAARFHYAHYWPYPHNGEDECYTRSLLDQQAACGWVTATTLHDYHFNAENQELTDGARSHLLWIATSVPAQHRTVYMSAGTSAEMTRMRTEATEGFFREMGIPNPPAVVARADFFEGRPANEVDRIRQLELMAIPKPRLFYIGAAVSGAGPGGGVAGGAGGPVGGAGATTTNNGMPSR